MSKLTRTDDVRMPIVRTVTALREALSVRRRRGERVGLVPTMGALHDGHLSLVRRARESCDAVVVSLFVNPSQFDERADLDRYPRQEARDAALAAQAGADLLFAPRLEDVYPAGFATTVEVLGLTDVLEGAVRGREHFRGVTTVVTKLLCMAMPDVAFFGQKDAQQLLVIRRLVEDLNLPIRIEACPTVRDVDGVALSSRNSLLSREERERARALPRALQAAQQLATAGERDTAALCAAARAAMLELGVQPEYVALVDPHTLEPLGRLEQDALLALAAHIGPVRLIDNSLLSPTPIANSTPAKSEVTA